MSEYKGINSFGCEYNLINKTSSPKSAAILLFTGCLPDESDFKKLTQ